MILTTNLCITGRRCGPPGAVSRDPCRPHPDREHTNATEVEHGIP